MSDQPSHERGAGPPPELTLEQEERVRRLLAEARHEDPLPAAVAARLDRVLAELPGARTAPEPEGRATSVGATLPPVVDLAARRRRRNVSALLAGAAAAIVAGFGVGQVIDVGQGRSDQATSSTEQADRVEDGAGADSDAGGASAPDTGLTAAEAPLRLTSGDLEGDVTEQLERLGASPAENGAVPEAGPGYDCAPAPASRYGRGELFAALFDGQPAVLALRPRSGATQEAEVLACGTADELASVTITPR